MLDGASTALVLCVLQLMVTNAVGAGYRSADWGLRYIVRAGRCR